MFKLYYNFISQIELSHNKSDLSYYHFNDLKLCNNKELYYDLCVKLIDKKIDNFKDVKYEKLNIKDYINLCKNIIVKKKELIKFINFEYIIKNSNENDINDICKLFFENNEYDSLLEQETILEYLSSSQRKYIDIYK